MISCKVCWKSRGDGGKKFFNKFGGRCGNRSFLLFELSFPAFFRFRHGNFVAESLCGLCARKGLRNRFVVFRFALNSFYVFVNRGMINERGKWGVSW